jgi:cell division septation protein DedD
MSRTGFRHLAIAATSLLALAACENTGNFADPGATARAAGPQAETTMRMVERDVEAPDVFQADDAGLWDGRPSLGGVWVAHPAVGDPERVIIRNEANGKFVIGALFRRERENPGPEIQVSSDAAAALGMLAGAPTVLNVTALRRVEEADPAQIVQPAPVQSLPAQPAVVTAEAAPPAPQIAQAPAAPLAAPAPAISIAELPRSGAVIAAEPEVALGGGRAPTPVMSPAVIAAATGAPTVAATPVSAPARSAPASSQSRIDRAFIQIGIFSVKDNATRTSQRMRAAGLQANMLEEQSQGQTFWRVTVGPTASTNESGQVLADVKGMGFTDAYAVSR